MGGGDGGLGPCRGVGPMTLTLALTHLSSQLVEVWPLSLLTPALISSISCLDPGTSLRSTPSS